MSLWKFLSSKKSESESERRDEDSTIDADDGSGEDELPDQQGATDDSSQPQKDVCTEICSQHENEVIQYFCPVHNSLGCGVCIMIEHRNCEGVIYIPKVAGELPESEEFKNFEKVLIGLKEKSESVIGTSKENIPKTQDNFRETIEAIEKFKKEKIDKLDELEDSLKTKASNCKTDNMEKMDDLLNKASTTKDRICQILYDMETFVSQKQCCKMYVEMKRTKDQLNTLHDILEKLERDNFIRTCKAVPSKRKLDIVESLEEEGPSTSSYELNGDNTEPESKRIKLTKNAEHPPELRAEYALDVFIKSETDKQIVCHIGGMVALSGNRLVIADKNNCTVKLVDTLQAKVVSELEMPSAPHGVARMSDKQVAVALKSEHSPKCDRILVLKTDPVLQAERLVRTNIMFEASSIDYRKNRFLVIKDNGCQIQEIDMVGADRTVDMCGQLFGSFAALSSSQTNDCIYVITTEHHEGCDEGYVLKKTVLDEELNTSGQSIQNVVYSDVFHMQHMADQTGRVYILGPGSIQIMDQQGSEPRFLLTMDNGIFHPSSVCLDQETNKLYVGMRDNNNIRVFKLMA